MPMALACSLRVTLILRDAFAGIFAAISFASNKADADAQVAMCGAVYQQAGMHMLEQLAEPLQQTIARVVKNGTRASGVGILRFLHAHCPPDAFDANGALADLLTDVSMAHWIRQCLAQALGTTKQSLGHSA